MEKQKLSFEAKIIIADRAIGNIIEIFLTTFLAAYFYKISEDNMIYISIYYIIAWICATIGALVLADYIKRKNKVKLYRYGTIIKAIYILLIIILKEKILDYVWLIGVMYGISVASTGFPLNMIESESVKEKERTKFSGYKSAIGEGIQVIVPIFLGTYITYTSYEIAAILLLVFSIIKVALTLFIKNKNVRVEPIKLRKFLEAVKEKKEYPIKQLYIIEFLKGITVHGVLGIVIQLLIIYEVKTELNLGIWSSIFSICMILTMTIFAKKYNRNNSKSILTISSIFIITSFIMLLFSINIVTIILYNIVYYIFVKMLLVITDIRLYDYSNKPPFEKEFNTEYFIFRELFLNLGRIFGFVILLIVGVMHNLECLKILFFLSTVALLAVIRISRNIEKNFTQTFIDYKNLPKGFIDKLANRYGVSTTECLKNIENIINKYQQKFNLKNNKLLENLTINLVFSSFCEEYGDVIIKIGEPNSIKSEIDFFLKCNSKYMAKLYYYNYEDGIMILEKINPGYSLTFVDSIDERIEIIKEIVKENPIKDFDKDVEYKKYFDSFTNKINDEKIYNNLNDEIKTMIEKAKKIYLEIQQMNLTEYVLHQDLHYKNILKSENSWKVIDPHGVLGYKVFELPQIIKAELKIANNDTSKLEEIILKISNNVNEDVDLICKSLYVDTVGKILYYISSKHEKSYINNSIDICKKIIKYIEKSMVIEKN